MNILITGGLGINGVWAVRELLAKGHQPVIFENRKDFSLVPDIADKLNVVLGDITEVASIIRALKEHKIKRIIHLAALMPQEAAANPVRGFNVNAVGTVNILEAARTMDVERVVFASSKAALGTVSGAYGYPTYKPIDESYPAGTATVYSACKVASELMGRTYAKLFGFEFVAFRFGTIYAVGKAGGGRHQALSKPSLMIENAMEGKPTVIPQGGDARDDLLWVKDCAQALVLGCLAESLPHQLYHIGTGQGYTLQEVGNAIKELYPEAAFDIGPGPDYMGGFGQHCVMDYRLAGKELGFKPHSLSEGVHDYVEETKRLKKD